MTNRERIEHEIITVLHSLTDEDFYRRVNNYEFETLSSTLRHICSNCRDNCNTPCDAAGDCMFVENNPVPAMWLNSGLDFDFQKAAEEYRKYKEMQK